MVLFQAVLAIMKICILIPAYNEEKAIGGLVKAVKKYGCDVLVLNDGSTDMTAQIAKNSGAIVLNFKNNRGKGKVLKDGFEYTVNNNYDAVITMDADGQHLPSDLPNFTGIALPQNIGVVTGNRMKNPENMPLLRFGTNIFMSVVISIVCRQTIPDTQCGFRLIRCDLLKKIRLISSNYEIESELLIKASKNGFKIRSVPVKSVYAGQASQINPVVDTWRFFIMLFRVIF